MRDLRVLVTGSASPDFVSTVKSLRLVDKYRVTILSIANQDTSIANALVDMLVDRSSVSSSLLDLSIENNVDVVIPTRSEDLSGLCLHLESFRENQVEPTLPVTDPKLMDIILRLPDTLEYSRDVLDVRVPDYEVVASSIELLDAAEELGHPDKPILFEPIDVGRNNRTRIVDDSVDFRKLFFEEKPTQRYTTLERLVLDLGATFPESMAMSAEPGDDYEVDVLCRKGKTFCVLPQRNIRSTIDSTAYRELVKDHNYQSIHELVERVIEGFGFSYDVGIKARVNQDGIPALLGITPHLRDEIGLSIHGGVNIGQSVLEMALQEFDYEFSPQVSWGLRMQRVWQEVIEYDGLVWKTEL